MGPTPRAKFSLERHEGSGRRAFGDLIREARAATAALRICGAGGRLPDRMARAKGAAKRAYAPACNPKAAMMVRGTGGSRRSG
jgi:hypothetical protein